MADEFYLDYDGAGRASSRFASRATELEQAAVTGAKGSVTGAQGPMGVATPVASAADDLLIATSGRLRAYGVELQSLAELIDDTIEVANEIDVAYVL